MAATNLQTEMLCRIDDDSWKAASNGRTLELQLERQPNGQLTETCRASVAGQLRDWLASLPGARPRTALCAIGARGVTLRKLTLPPSRPEDLEKVLSLQVEREFPLPPAQLAWGYLTLKVEKGQPTQVLVAAARKEFVDDYAGIVTGCGLQAVFTLGLLAQSAVAARTHRDGVLLSLNRHGGELAVLESGIPTGIRTFAWNGAKAPRAAEVIGRTSSATKVLLSGEVPREFPAELTQALGNGTAIELLAGGRDGDSPNALATLGELQRSGQSNRLLQLRTGVVGTAAEKVSTPLPYRWLALAAALVVGMCIIRYAPAVMRKPALEQRMKEVRTAYTALPPIEREVDFLRAIEKTQPAYLNALAALADATPRGTKVESITLNRRGEFTFVATLQGQQPNDLRSKLLDSGIFTNAVIEEQRPDTRNERQLTLRIRAKWDSSPDVKSPLLEKIQASASTNAPAQKEGM